MPTAFIRSMLIAAVLVPETLSSIGMPVPTQLHPADVVRDKNFYALGLFAQSSVLRHKLALNPELQRIQAERTGRLRDAQTACEGKSACALAPLLWSDKQIEAVAAALRGEYRASVVVRNTVEQLRRTGAYQLYEDQDGPTLLTSAWRVCARGLNQVISVYGQGAKPLYPQIDSASYDVDSATFQELAASVVEDLLVNHSGPEDVFFSASLEAALRLLRVNHRDEAARFEPLKETLNRVALRSLNSVDWSKYSYSVLLVPGEGPGDATTPLATQGRARIALAAEVFRRGEAPFILVSGGFVHPAQTRFAEAVEMKAALIRDFGIPESAILMDPYARHTTTNLRNAAREVYRNELPFQRPMLIVSDSEQIRYIASSKFAVRCQTELGYMPADIRRQVSDTELAVQPRISSLEENPLDPLDP